jgi:exodeoxyribonuclease VII small subunit
MASKQAPDRRGSLQASTGGREGEGPPAFEALYKELEDTVAKLEQGNLSLEESLSLYETGMQLARQCQALLQNAELRVSRLQTEFNESLNALRETGPEYGAEPEFELDEAELPLE